MNEDIDSMDFKETFYHLQTFIDKIGEEDEKGKPMYEDLPAVYDKARWGINLKFDAYFYLTGTMMIKAKTGKALYKGKCFDLSEIFTELEERTIEMKKWINNNTPNTLNISAYN